MTRLVLAAHGSPDPAAHRSAVLLARQVATLAGVATRAAFLQHATPSVADALAGAAAAAPRGGVVLAPLLLAGGYHLAADLRPAAAAAGARIAAPLGPDALLAEALAGRLAEAGVPMGTPVVLAAAGSSHRAAAADIRRQAALLARRWHGPVRAAYATAAAPSVEDAVAKLAGPGGRPVAVASCLLAPGVFHTRLLGAGAAWVTAPLGGHPAVARLVARRFLTAGRAPPTLPAGLVTEPVSSPRGWPRTRAGRRSGARPSGTCRR